MAPCRARLVVLAKPVWILYIALFSTALIMELVLGLGPLSSIAMFAIGLHLFFKTLDVKTSRVVKSRFLRVGDVTVIVAGWARVNGYTLVYMIYASCSTTAQLLDALPSGYTEILDANTCNAAPPQLLLTSPDSPVELVIAFRGAVNELLVAGRKIELPEDESPVAKVPCTWRFKVGVDQRGKI